MPGVMLNHRRAVLAALGGLVGQGALSACTSFGGSSPTPRAAFTARRISPILMAPERIIRITVCTRPFRAAGPRLDVERVADTLVVHNYGHGGSGWSLSWGSSGIAARKAMALSGESPSPAIAVIGCGALGLTSALQLQRLGARVVIYARERIPFTRSMRATGTWTPDSRIADADKVDPDFPALWERMARESFASHQTYLGIQGDPVVFQDRYILARARPGPQAAPKAGEKSGPPEIRFAEYGERLHDIVPRSVSIPVEQAPFPGIASARFGSGLQFNVTELAHRLMTEFLMGGGRIETREFHTPAEIAGLDEKVVINCTGYGARSLFDDQTITPVRGQITWLAPQPEVDYSLFYAGVAVISRPDGIVVQNTRGGDMVGYGSDDETPDRAEAETTMARVAPLFPAIRPPSTD